MELLVNMVFGSHLYGTATPDSDRDYKSLFIPPLQSLLIGHAPKTMCTSTKTSTHTKNTSADIDREAYALSYFLELAYNGETVAMDMLHAPAHALLVSSPIWEDLVTHRHRFYTRNLTALVGYARHQAAKYGAKGSRLHAAARVLDFLRRQTPTARLAEIWETLPEGDYIEKTHNGVDALYEVCGKKMAANGRCAHYVTMLERFTERYGERSRLAERNEGIDWKAISHACRAGYQVKHILIDGGFTYPLPETAFLRAVKQGSLSYRTEVEPHLNALLDEVHTLSAQSALPKTVDRTWWEQWLIRVLYDWYGIHHHWPDGHARRPALGPLCGHTPQDRTSMTS